MRRAAAIAAVILGSVAFLWPARAGLLGDPDYEVHNHLWYFAHVVGGVEANFPSGWDLPLMDPPNLPWFALGWWVSPAWAWNGTAAANVALGAWGGWVLGAQLGGTRTSAWAGMAAVAWSPFLGGEIEFGVTEAWPLGWFALHVAAMDRLRERQSAMTATFAGISLGIFALTGWYHAAFVLLVEPWLAWRIGRWRAVAGVASLALVLVLPRFLQLLPHLDVWTDRAAALSDPTDIRAWQRQERYGIDLLRFLPTADVFSPSRSVYLGIASVSLAALGGRRSVPWLAMAAPLWALALGHWLRMGGKVVHVGGPVELPAGFLVDHLETARFITHWYRAAGPASVLLAGAAAVGAGRLERWISLSLGGPTGAGMAAGEAAASSEPRRPNHRLIAALGPAIAALFLADSLLLSGTRWPRIAAPLPLPAALPLDGPVLDLPIDDNRTPPERYGSRRPYWMWQLTHGQSVAENYEADDAVLARSGEARALQLACGGLPRPRPGASGAGHQDAGSENISLVELGFRWIVVHDGLAPGGCAEAVAARFGPATATVEGASGWRIGGGG